MNNSEIASAELGEIASFYQLNAAIKKLEAKKYLMEESLKDDFHSVLESLKPANIIKNTVNEFQESTELRHNLLKVLMGLGAGYFSRKLLVGKSAGVIKKAIGVALQYGIANFIAKKDNQDEDVKHSKKKNLLKRILSV